MRIFGENKTTNEIIYAHTFMPPQSLKVLSYVSFVQSSQKSLEQSPATHRIIVISIKPAIPLNWLAEMTSSKVIVLVVNTSGKILAY